MAKNTDPSALTTTSDREPSKRQLQRQMARKRESLAETIGYEDNDINVLMSDDTRKRYYGDGENTDTELGSKAAEGATTGGAIGGTLGAIIAGIAAIGTNLVLPGIGLVVWGPLAAALAGLGAGGLTGGIVGALIGAGIPEERAKEYEEGIKSGGTVLGVTPRSNDDAEYFRNDWATNHRGQSINY